MIKGEPIRNCTLYARIQKVNKEMIEEKSRLANMDEAPFVDRLLTVLRTTEEGQSLMALDEEFVAKKRVK